ncbi:MAG: hypothetical protein U5K38_03355, partial [Woeseiaceae bacterium]|nr:hypothetical protein [Woeseiaceae bacterium]
ESPKLRPLGWVFEISDDSRLSTCVVVAEEATALISLWRRAEWDGEPHDVAHWHAGASFLLLAVVLRESFEFVFFWYRIWQQPILK